MKYLLLLAVLVLLTSCCTSVNVAGPADYGSQRRNAIDLSERLTKRGTENRLVYFTQGGQRKSAVVYKSMGRWYFTDGDRVRLLDTPEVNRFNIDAVLETIK